MRRKNVALTAFLLAPLAMMALLALLMWWSLAQQAGAASRPRPSVPFETETR